MDVITTKSIPSELDVVSVFRSINVIDLRFAGGGSRTVLIRLALGRCSETGMRVDPGVHLLQGQE